MKNKVYITVLIGLIIDQFVKFLIKENLKLYESIKVIPGFFSIRYVENTGAAFSILENATFILIIISLVVFLYLVHYINKEEKSLDNISSIALGMIMGGVLGNLIDRLLYNKVIDFLSFKIINYNFPVFNIADTLIALGIILLIGNFIFLEYRKGKSYVSRRKRCEKKN